MSDPREALRANLAHWLRLRAEVRAIAARLTAHEHERTRDARHDADPALAILAAQLAAERRAILALGAELDARIAHVQRDVAAIGDDYVATIAATARVPAEADARRKEID